MPFAAPILAAFAQPVVVTTEEHVAEAVWRAVTDPSCPMRLPAGADAQEWAGERPARG